MVAQLSARKFREWQVYAELEPFGAPAGFWRSGMLAGTLANVHRSKKSQKAFTPEDFMPSQMVAQPDASDPQDVGDQVARAFQDLATLHAKTGVTHEQ